MSANYQTSAFAGCPVSQLPLAPPRLGASLGVLGAVAAALLRGRELLESLNRRWRNRRTGNGGPETPPEDHATRDSIWDDPELWMLMMH